MFFLGYEVLTESKTISKNQISKVFNYTLTNLVTSNPTHGSRKNVPKIIVLMLGSESVDDFNKVSRLLRDQPFLATIVFGYGKASLVRFFNFE